MCIRDSNIYCNAVRGGLRHSHTQQAHEFWWSSAVWFPSYASGQTDRQTDRQTDILITILHKQLFSRGHVTGVSLASSFNNLDETNECRQSAGILQTRDHLHHLPYHHHHLHPRLHYTAEVPQARRTFSVAQRCPTVTQSQTTWRLETWQLSVECIPPLHRVSC